MIGRIIKGVGGKFEVLTEEGVFISEARGIFKRDDERLLPGDIVELGDHNRIDKLYPRKNELIRPPISNITMMVLVFAVAHPNPNLRIIDTVIANAELQGLKLLLVINKVDLDPEKASDFAKIYDAFDVIGTSSATEEGVDELRKKIEGEVAVFSGASGAGKSTLLNHIVGEDYFEVGEISEKSKRGKNTTRHVEFYPLGDTLIADSPGYTSLVAMDIESTELSKGFREFNGIKCKFLDCTHRKEPGCGVREAFERGEVPKSRYESYMALYEEILNQERNRYR